MKRFLVTLLVLIVSLSLFASSFTSYRPLEREYRAMGSSGMALSGVGKGFYTNPAALSNDKFNLVLPALEVGVGSFSEIVTIPFSALGDGNFDAINEVLSKLTGTIPILDVKASSSLTLFGFGAAIDASGGIYTSGEGISVGLIPFLKVAGSFGYGRGFDIRDDIKLEVGAVAHVSSFFYSSPIGVSELLDLFASSSLGNFGLKFTNMTFTMDVGTTLRLDDGLSFALALTDMGKGVNSVDMITGEEEKFDSDFSINIGGGWERVFWKWLGIKASIDFNDIVGFVKDASFSNFLYHTNMGLKVNLTKGIGLMCGLKGGYPSLGADLKLWFIDLSVLYTMDEYSEYMGYNPRDTLSLLLRLEF
ncbi:MAG: hypothetical protein ACI4SL_09380 [Candidatus Ornithospirochaeta sp.]